MKPFDPERAKAFESATKLLLAPGAAQIFYGDEVGRDLTIAETRGDATLRSNFDWTAAARPETEALLAHWRKLGAFRKAHPAVGAGLHRELSAEPYVFSRTLDGAVKDRVVVALGLKAGETQTLDVGGAFADGDIVVDGYTGAVAKVKKGRVRLRDSGPVALLAAK
jgi:alpha-amylase